MWICERVTGADLDIDEVAALYQASTLGERRPVDDRDRFARMLRGANLVITARLDGRLIGIARSLTDGAYATYLSDLAVDAAFQRQGVGRDLIRATREAAPAAKVILLSAPAAVDYYPRVGFVQHPSAWTLDPASRLR
ncbi:MULTISPECIES: GNAT family N-acetyltransferase [Streptomyces]|uniref:GNAT family N-acetyltransferase n=1 Tax=Streptomyces TaxID=1883 RepID=UPI00167220F7|nr:MULTISPECIES: GNAT family N-acetyltransferase [Streptomyces]MBK3525772.1 GNAT family N-acetyltransferase [Streptomyces sp. MBT70]GGS13789.1 N-acetyltransferase [Streptomyces eurythermus]